MRACGAALLESTEPVLPHEHVDKKPDLTLNDLVGELAEHHGITIHRVSV